MQRRVVPYPPHYRIEYLGFRNLDQVREYGYAVHSPEGSCEFRFRIAMGAFATARVMIQDGPDICYQQLARELAEGDNLQHQPRCIRPDELRAYHEAHIVVPRKSFAAAASRRVEVPARQDG